MAFNSSIEWTEHTVNLWHGCTAVSPGCELCYAETQTKRYGHNFAVRREVPSAFKSFAKMQADAAAAGVRARVFVGSMMDIFEKIQPLLTWHGEPTQRTTMCVRDKYFLEVIPATPNLIHLLLTKRPGNILKMVPPKWLEPGGWPENVVTGTSPVNQETANILIPQLCAVPGVHFLSCEPLLGPIDFYAASATWPRRIHPWLNAPILEGIQQLIIGGESGPGARRMNLAWVYDLIRQCRMPDVSCKVFVKQLGRRPFLEEAASFEVDQPGFRMKVQSLRAHFDYTLSDAKGGNWDEWPADLRIREHPYNLIAA